VATATVNALTRDNVVSLHVIERPLDHYLAMVGGSVEGQPLLKCSDRRITLVSPGRSHEQASFRLAQIIVEICSVLKIPVEPFGSTLYPIPGTGRGYMPDEAFLIQGFEAGALEGDDDPRPDLVIEIVVTHPEYDALAACAGLGVPEVWVLDVPRNRLAFLRLVTRGKEKGKYVPIDKSRMLPRLKPEAVLTLLDEPPRDMAAFSRRCRDFARRVLIPRPRGAGS